MSKGYANRITYGAITAALYVVLTLLSDMFGLAIGQFQIRLSEGLTVLPVFLPEAIPGLTVGCIIANVLSGCVITDVIAGSLATMAAAYLTYRFRNNKLRAMLQPVIINGAVIPFVLRYCYGVGPLWLNFLSIIGSEAVSVFLFGTFCYNLSAKLDFYRQNC